MQLIPHRTVLWAVELRTYDPMEFGCVKGIFKGFADAVLAAKNAYRGVELNSYEDGSIRHQHYVSAQQTHICIRRFIVNTMSLPPEG